MWEKDQFHGHGILYNQNPVMLHQSFNFKDFEEVDEYWVKYEGKCIFIQVNSTTIKNVDWESYTWQTESKYRPCSRTITSTAKVALLIYTDRRRMGLGKWIG